jgi:hypothetical protein
MAPSSIIDITTILPAGCEGVLSRCASTLVANVASNGDGQ